MSANIPHVPGGSGWAPLPPPPAAMPTPPPMPGAASMVGPGLPFPATLSSPWRRLGARLIDALVFIPVWFVVFFAFFVDQFREDPLFAQIEAGQPLTQSQTQELVGRFQGKIFMLSLAIMLVYGVYDVLFTRLKGQTLGKMAVGIKVVNERNGALPSWGSAGVRWGLPAAVSLIPGIGGIASLFIYLWMLWDPKKQGLHDKAAKTLVIRT